MAGTPCSPVLVPSALLPKRRHHAKRRILDTNATHSLRKKLNFDENARSSFEDEPEVLYIAESPVKKIKLEPESPANTQHKKEYDDQKENKSPNICQLDIGNDMYVVANRFRGKHWIHIRTYEKRQDNSIFPTKRGVALDLEKWTKLTTWHADELDNAIKEYDEKKDTDVKIHLGDNYYVCLKKGYPVVNIRKWFLPENEKNIVPTRKGTTLTFRQWEKVKDAMVVLQDLIGKELNEVTFCELEHLNQMGMLECTHCNPNGMEDYTIW